MEIKLSDRISEISIIGKGGREKANFFPLIIGLAKKILLF